MEDKRLKQFTFYDLYYEALKGLPDEGAGRMAKNPKIKNDIYASRMHLLDGVNWMKPDCGLEKSEYGDCDSLYRIVMHKEEIMNNAW